MLKFKNALITSQQNEKVVEGCSHQKVLELEQYLKELAGYISSSYTVSVQLVYNRFLIPV